MGNDWKSTFHESVEGGDTSDHDVGHKPTDDPNKVDTEAEAGILDIEIQLIENALKRPKLNFMEVK